MSKRLEGKTSVITGGTEGIGLATAKLFVKEGAYVFITGRRQKELDEAVKAIGTNVSGIQGDVANLADLDRLYETVSNAKGRIDIVFANAGVGEFVPFGAITEEHFDKSSANGYERLLLDAMLGDATLFSHRDGVEAAWALFTPILEAWAKDPDASFPNYPAGSWGPANVATLFGDEPPCRDLGN